MYAWERVELSESELDSGWEGMSTTKGTAPARSVHMNKPGVIMDRGREIVVGRTRGAADTKMADRFSFRNSRISRVRMRRGRKDGSLSLSQGN